MQQYVTGGCLRLDERRLGRSTFFGSAPVTLIRTIVASVAACGRGTMCASRTHASRNPSKGSAISLRRERASVSSTTPIRLAQKQRVARSIVISSARSCGNARGGEVRGEMRGRCGEMRRDAWEHTPGRRDAACVKGNFCQHELAAH